MRARLHLDLGQLQAAAKPQQIDGDQRVDLVLADQAERQGRIGKYTLAGLRRLGLRGRTDIRHVQGGRTQFEPDVRTLAFTGIARLAGELILAEHERQRVEHDPGRRAARMHGERHRHRNVERHAGKRLQCIRPGEGGCNVQIERRMRQRERATRGGTGPVGRECKIDREAGTAGSDGCQRRHHALHGETGTVEPAFKIEAVATAALEGDVQAVDAKRVRLASAAIAPENTALLDMAGLEDEARFAAAAGLARRAARGSIDLPVASATGIRFQQQFEASQVELSDLDPAAQQSGPADVAFDPLHAGHLR